MLSLVHKVFREIRLFGQDVFSGCVSKEILMPLEVKREHHKISFRCMWNHLLKLINPWYFFFYQAVYKSFKQQILVLFYTTVSPLTAPELPETKISTICAELLQLLPRFFFRLVYYYINCRLNVMTTINQIDAFFFISAL